MTAPDNPPLQLRQATADDAAKLLAIYASFVQNTIVSFETVVPEVSDFAARIEKANEDWCWLLAEVEGRVAGYAYGTAHRPRHAYRHSVETSAYMDPAFQRQGIASRLYDELLQILAEQGHHMAFAGIALPNDASVAFHRHHGFQDIGVFPEVGHKFNAWHDTRWLYRPLQSSSLHSS